MTHSKLKSSLRQLQQEIENLKSIPAPEKTELETIMNSIHRLVDADETNDTDSIQQNLDAAITRLESSHPRLTAVLNDIMVTLSNMGI
ncbi:MAG TPA: DUF4404 family protein [Gammaproteobacteria bacterium]